ncbi:MAG: Gx transporter family protein [Clostridia bacterium]|nr:Gx transporter family protein [Clostridia bacterium]
MQMRMQGRAKGLALGGLFLAAALLLSYVESILGLHISFLPGMKIGLANVVIAFTFFEISKKTAAAVSFGRVLIMGILFGSAISFLYSAFGALLSFGGMLLISRFEKSVSYVGTSVLCACLHNVGQSAVAACFFGIEVASFYLPYLLICGVCFGSFTGALLNFISKKYVGVVFK